MLAVPTTAEALARLQAVLDDLLDLVGEDAAHPLAPWLNVIGERIETYEAQHYPMPEAASPAELLKHLLEVHGLRQSDLPEIGSQGVVSEILSVQREFNLSQCTALAWRFKLDPANFVPAIEPRVK